MKYALILELPFNIVLIYRYLFKTEIGALRKQNITKFLDDFEVIEEEKIPNGAIKIPFRSGARKKYADIVCREQRKSTEKKTV